MNIYRDPRVRTEALDELVQENCAAMASCINNEGKSNQLHFLLCERHMCEDEIYIALGIDAGESTQ